MAFTLVYFFLAFFFFSSRRRHTRSLRDWSSDVCSSDLLVLGDEVLTPDSSRFWPAETYKPGGPQFSFDKQFVRDYLESIKWNKQPPAPPLPQEVADKTSEKYRQAYGILTGHELCTGWI